ncbi:hypothetical protein [Kytococcus sp. Marseille-QA3725]
MKRFGQVLTALGVLGLVIGAVIFGWGVVQAAQTGEALTSGQTISGSTEVELEEGDHHLLTTPLDSDSSATCTVTDPDGSSVGTTPSEDDEYTAEDEVELVGAFDVDDSGTHRVDCTGDGVKLTDHVDPNGFAFGGLGLLGGLLLGGLAFLVTVLGIILWVAGAKRDRRGSGGYGGPGGYDQYGYGASPAQPGGGYTQNPSSFGQPGTPPPPPGAQAPAPGRPEDPTRQPGGVPPRGVVPPQSQVPQPPQGQPAPWEHDPYAPPGDRRY